MKYDIVTVIRGTVVSGDDPFISLAQLCRTCNIPVETVMALVDEGILKPTGSRPGLWRFSVNSPRHASAAVRLQSDLELGLPGVALTLELLDRIERLQTQVKIMESRLYRQKSGYHTR